MSVVRLRIRLLKRLGLNSQVETQGLREGDSYVGQPASCLNIGILCGILRTLGKASKNP